ncbi:MAG: LysR family transcriptional regulator [Clostridiales bacterium]|nr:LysR family transcriptional regulator [Clostridiales bacterium]
MTTRQMYYLVTIADQRNLSAAANILGISQPALSKFLTEYEDSLGFLLFLRYHRQLTPTAAGRCVIDYAQRILDEQIRMLQTIRTVTNNQHAHIRLATAPNRGAIIYSRIYNEFSRRYPDISLSLTELYASEQPSAIQHGKIDLAIGAGKTSDKVTDLPFAFEELLVSLPVSHPMSWAKSIRLSDLKDTPFVLQGERHSIRILADELFREAGFSPLVAFESNDVILIDSMLHQAVGAGLVSQAHVFPCQDLVYRPLEPPVHQTLHIRYPLGHTLTEPERYLAALLIRERLSDLRYTAIRTPEVEEFLHIADSPSGEDISPQEKAGETTRAPAIHQTAPEIQLNTQILKYILSIVDEKSLTAAAETNYLTQPALSRHLRNVEKMVCTQLFTRVHNRLQPTNAGKIFANSARNLLRLEEDLVEQLKTYRLGHGGGVYLSCDPILVPRLRESVETQFSSRYPDVLLSIIEGDRSQTEEALLNASADLGLYFSCDMTHPILNCKSLSHNELLYCQGTSRHPDSMERTVMLAPAGSSLRAEQERLLDDVSGSPLSIVCEARSDILSLLTQTGTADTILPQSLLPPEVLARCVPFKSTQVYHLILAHHPGRNLPKHIRELAQILAEALENYFT